jgi:hypothetical protein
MTYTLFVWTVVAAAAGWQEMPRTYKDWRAVATVESIGRMEDNQDTMLAKCAGVARELNIDRERYRCVRTK